MNLCVKNFGIMNNETLRQNTLINQLRSIQGMQDMAFQRVKFSQLFWVACPRTSLYKSIGADSPLVSPVTWCLMFSSKKGLHT